MFTPKGFNCKRQRCVHLHEDRREIFNVSVNEDQALEFFSNSELFKMMLYDQGLCFWLKFCTTLKTVLEKEGYCLRRRNYFQDFFMELVDRLTSNSLSNVETYIIDVLNISMSCQFFQGINISSVPGNHNVKDAVVSAKRLFNNLKIDTVKLCCTFPLHLRAVGSLLRVFYLWKITDSTEKSYWRSPENWIISDGTLPRKYEDHIRRKWGEKLLDMLDLTMEDIVWWETTYVEGDGFDRIVVKSSTKYGYAIRVNVQESLLNMQKEHQLYGRFPPDKMFIHLSIFDLPKGANIMLFNRQDYYHMLYWIASCREVNSANCKEVFLPYLQFVYGLCSMTFSRQFWKTLGYAKNVDETAEKNTKESKDTKNRNTKKDDKMIKYVSTAMGLLGQFRMAIYLDSRYYASVSSETTWDSPDVIVRLFWNMPLCLNWLQILLLQIYEFEGLFLPFVHFPSPKHVRPLVEHLYLKYCKRARFLVKAAVIVANYIHVNEENTPDRCYDARLALKFAICTCVPIMKFFKGPLYQIFEVIIRESFTEFGEKISEVYDDNLETDYDKVKFCTCCIPDLDQAFNTHHRAISFWLGRKIESHSLEESLHFYPEALKALQQYEVHMKEHKWQNSKCDEISQPAYTYHEKIYSDAYEVNVPVDMLSPTENDSTFIKDMIDLLVEDQLLVKEHILINASSDTTAITNEEKQMIQKLVNVGKVYVVCAAVVGDTCGENVIEPDQVLLTRLLNAECRSAMADAASSFIVMAQHYQSQKDISPSHKYIKAARNAIAVRELTTLLSISEALSLISGSQEHYSVDSISLSALEVPSVKTAETYSTDMYYNFLADLHRLRLHLLCKISENQFLNTEIMADNSNTFSNTMYPHLMVLEYSFITEMAALKHCLKKGDKFKTEAKRLASLLSYRAEWLVKEYRDWSAAGICPECVEVNSIPPTISDVIKSTVLGILSLIVPVTSLLNIYVNNDSITYPAFKSILNIIGDANEFILRNLRSRIKKNNLNFGRFYDAVKIMGIDYFNNLLDHLLKAWNIPELCTDLKQKAKRDSRQHYEKIYSVLLHSTLLCCYRIMNNKETLLLSKSIKSASFLEFGMLSPYVCINDLIGAEELLHTAAVRPYSEWNDLSLQIQKHFKNIVKWVKACMKNHIHNSPCISANVPRWRGYFEKNYFFYESFTLSPSLNHLLKNIERLESRKKGNKNLYKKLTQQTKLQISNKEKEKRKNVKDHSEQREGIVTAGTSLVTEDGSGDHAKYDTKNEKRASEDKKFSRSVKRCFSCGIPKSEERTLRKCSLCFQYKWKMERLYCSYQCQAKDWKERHGKEHVETADPTFTVSSSTT